MNLKKRIEDRIPAVAEKLKTEILSETRMENDDMLGIAARTEVLGILDDLLKILFPNCFHSNKLSRTEIHDFLEKKLRRISTELLKYLKNVFKYHCVYLGSPCSKKTYDICAEEALEDLIENLPEIKKKLQLDIDAALKGDPAAKSPEEIILSYPFLEAVATYRIANRLYKKNVPVLPRIMSEHAHSKTGIDINPGATIGTSFFIDHGTGVVIGETCRIGNNVKIYQGVTLGALSPFDKKGRPKTDVKRHPDIDDNVIIYSNATILGGDTVIGRGAIIGGNSWITKSVPPDTKIKGNTSHS